MAATAINIVAPVLPGAPTPGVPNAAGQAAGPLAGFEALLAALLPQADPTVAAPTPGVAIAADANGDLPAGDPDKDAQATAGPDSLTDMQALASADPNAALAASLAATPAAAIAPVTASAPVTAPAEAPRAGRPQTTAPGVFAVGPAPVATTTATAATGPEVDTDPPASPTAELPLLAKADPAPAKTGAPRAAAQSLPPVEVATTSPAQAKVEAAGLDTPAPDAPSASQAAPAPSAVANPTTASVAASTLAAPAAPTPKSARPERAKTSVSDLAPVGDPKAPQAADKLATAQAVTPATRLAAREAETADAGGRPANASLDQPDTAAGGETHAATQGSAPLAHAAHAVRGAPETVANLAAQIIKKLEGQSTRFDVELDPQGLGKVNVRIDIGAQGAITAAMSFDNPQAAAELRSRAAELQRALEQAGFNLSGGVTFDVAQERGQHNPPWQQPGQDDTNAGRAFRGQAFQSALDTAGDAADAALGGALRLRRGVNAGLDMRI